LEVQKLPFDNCLNILSMKIDTVLEQLAGSKVISSQQKDRILEVEQNPLFSIHWELRTLLYLGITLLSGGLGTLIYQNIDSIGHSVIVAVIAILCLASFGYAFWKRLAFSTEEVSNPSPFADFALLLGCLLFVTLEGYVQYQYNLFGTRYGLVTFLPAILFIGLAYLFDHRGVLSMGLTALASWVGLAISPEKLFSNDFTNQNLLILAIVLGLFLVLIGWLSERYSFKKHFAFTYFFLGGNLTAIASLTGLFNNEGKIVYFIIIMALSVLGVMYARQKHSFLFLLLGIIYGYIAFTYTFFTVLSSISSEVTFMFSTLYFFATCAGIVVFFIKIKDILGWKK
jgi:Predicted membrane protein (DUF2157)